MFVVYNCKALPTWLVLPVSTYPPIACWSRIRIAPGVLVYQILPIVLLLYSTLAIYPYEVSIPLAWPKSWKGGLFPSRMTAGYAGRGIFVCLLVDHRKDGEEREQKGKNGFETRTFEDLCLPAIVELAGSRAINTVILEFRLLHRDTALIEPVAMFVAELSY